MKGLIYGFLSSFVWALSFAFMKKLDGVYSAYEIVFYRYFFAAIIFMFITFMAKEKLFPNKKDLGNVLVSSLFGITLFSLLSIVSMNWLSTSILGMLNGTIPAITLLIEKFWYKKRLTNNMKVSLLLSLSGIILMSIPLGFGEIIGYALALLALFLWVIYSFMISNLTNSYSDIQLMGFQNFYGSIVLLPFVFIYYGKSSFIKLLEFEVLAVMLFLSIVITALGYLLYLKGNKLIGVAKMSLLLNLIPVFSLLAGYFMYQEEISGQKIIGLILVISSIFLMTPGYSFFKIANQNKRKSQNS